jgi:predicted transcriptional regulator
MTMTDSSRISFVTASSKRTRLDEIAHLFGKNRSDVINEALDHYIALHEWQLRHIHEGLEEAKQGDFAPDAEVDAFFERYGQPL